MPATAATRARGCLLGILGVVVGLGVVGDGIDIGARHYATGRIEQRIKADLPSAQGVRGRIRSFPFLKVFISGRIDEMGAHIDRLQETPVTFTAIDVDLRGVVIDAGPLVTEGRVTVKRIKEGTVSATITAPQLAAAIGHAVPGALTVSVDAVHRTFSVAGAGVPLISLPLPTADLLPCIPAARVQDGAITLSCTFTHVPTALTTLATS